MAGATESPVVLSPRQVGLTIRGAALLGFGVVLAVVAWRGGQPGATGMAVAAVLGVLTAIGWQWVAPPPILRVRAADELIQIGDATTVRVDVLRTLGLVGLIWPREGRARTAARAQGPQAVRRGTASDATFVRTFAPPRRGSFALGPLAAMRYDPFSLTRATFVYDDSAIVDVAPAVLDISASAVIRAATSGPALHGAAGDRAMHARSWHSGDVRRDVHWRATARTGRLMAHERDSIAPDLANVIFDSGDDRLDATRATWAASIAAALVRAGWRVDVRGAAEAPATGGWERLRSLNLLLQRIARTPVESERAWPALASDAGGSEFSATTVAVLSGQAPPLPADGQCLAVIVGEPWEHERVHATVANARHLGWNAVAVLTHDSEGESDPASLIAALDALARPAQGAGTP